MNYLKIFLSNPGDLSYKYDVLWHSWLLLKPRTSSQNYVFHIFSIIKKIIWLIAVVLDAKLFRTRRSIIRYEYRVYVWKTVQCTIVYTLKICNTTPQWLISFKFLRDLWGRESNRSTEIRSDRPPLTLSNRCSKVIGQWRPCFWEICKCTHIHLWHFVPRPSTAIFMLIGQLVA